MARGRMLNKTISASLKFADLPNDTCRLLATWIIPHLDKNGVYYGNAALVRSYVFPLRDDLTTDDIESFLQELERVGLMHRFEANGRVWQHWPGFDENQVGLRKEREGTEFPDPPQPIPADAEPVPVDAEAIPDESGNHPAELQQPSGIAPAEYNGKELKSKGSKKEDNDAADAAPPPPKAPTNGNLTEGQAAFLRLWNAKKYTPAQFATVLALEREHGTDKLLEAAEWAANKPMTMGSAINALKKALPNWGKPRTEGTALQEIPEWR